MVDYYKILGVQTKATNAEIKSAYRKLARLRHPDVNGGSEASAREFALISLAYRTLSNPQERAYYDSQRERLKHRSHQTANAPHANPYTASYAAHLRRARAQVRMNRVIDSLLESDRRETLALQQAVFPLVALFFSTFLAPILRPHFWQSAGLAGRSVMLILSIVGLWHFIGRFRACVERYSYQPKLYLERKARQEIALEKPFTRRTAYAFITLGLTFSLGLGLVLGSGTQYSILSAMPGFFDHRIHPELLLYPPIVILIVDTLHTITLKIDI